MTKYGITNEWTEKVCLASAHWDISAFSLYNKTHHSKWGEGIATDSPELDKVV